MSLPKDTLDRIVELGNSRTIETPKDGQAFAIIPETMQAEDLSKFFPPTFVERNVQLFDAGSFSDYVNRFKSENTLIFANVKEAGASLKAILDYHGPKDAPARCAHVAEFSTIQTPEWKAWLEANKKSFDQVGFATWLEDNQTLFIEPKGADLLELVQTLEGKNNVRFNSAVRLQGGGSKLDFEEDVVLKGSQSTKTESVELPQFLTASIAPFNGMEQVQVRARLKYRIESRKLSLWYETVALHKIVRDAVLNIVEQVAKETTITPFIGNT